MDEKCVDFPRQMTSPCKGSEHLPIDQIGCKEEMKLVKIVGVDDTRRGVEGSMACLVRVRNHSSVTWEVHVDSPDGIRATWAAMNPQA